MKPRATETAVVRSLHPALAPVGTIKHMTPAEADLMVSMGRAEHVEGQPEQEPYRHRMMVAQQPQARKRGGK